MSNIIDRFLKSVACVGSIAVLNFDKIAKGALKINSELRSGALYIKHGFLLNMHP